MNKKWLAIGISLIAIFLAIKYRHFIINLIQSKLGGIPKTGSYSLFGTEPIIETGLEGTFIDDIMEGC